MTSSRNFKPFLGGAGGANGWSNELPITFKTDLNLLWGPEKIITYYRLVKSQKWVRLFLKKNLAATSKSRCIDLKKKLKVYNSLSFLYNTFPTRLKSLGFVSQ